MERTAREITPNDRSTPLTESVLAALNDAIRGVRYGTVTVIVQDGRVVQIDRTERRRLKSDSDT